MLNSRFKKIAVAVLLTMVQTFSFAQAENQEVDPASKALMYIPDRVADIFDIVNVGIAVGPSIGLEVAITKYFALGAYASNEVGIAWTGRNNPYFHQGAYQTAVIGNLRTEIDVDNTHYFHRGDYQIRAQLAVVLVHGYVGIDLKEIGDFVAGIFTYDPSGDDNAQFKHTQANLVTPRFPTTEADFAYFGAESRVLDKDYDSILGYSPMHRLGRGFSNLLFGIWEIPQNWMDVTADQGYVAGATYGTVRGVGRFLVREVTGVWEIITFPKGGPAIIQPEYPFMPHVEHTWNYNFN